VQGFDRMRVAPNNRWVQVSEQASGVIRSIRPSRSFTVEENHMSFSLLLQTDTEGAGYATLGLVLGLIYLVLSIVAYWRIFTKAEQPGWPAIIPIYNVIVLLRVVGRPWWWLLLMLIPLVNFVILIIVLYDLAKSFGHGIGYTIGLILLSIIFALLLAFGGSEYRGPAGRGFATA
jgi:hypothetical protein